MELLSFEHWTLVADAVIAVLLIATITYAAVLERRLAALRAAKREMAELVGHFAGAVKRAESGLAEIKQTAEQTGRELQQTVDKGNSLADDLVFLVERGDAVAGRLERSTAKGRNLAQPPAAGAESAGPEAAQSSAAAETAQPEGERTPEQSALMAALRAMR